MKKIVGLLILVLSLIGCGKETVESFPTKPLELLMPWPAGGSSDTQARVLIQSSEEVFGQPFVIIDRSGAGGTRGAMAGKMAKPDGYSVLWASGEMFTLTPNKLKVEYSLEDFKPVLGATLEATLVVTSKDSGINSLNDLKNIENITFGSPGAASGPGMALTQLMEAMGINASQVPFEGTNKSSTAALGNHVTIADSNMNIVRNMPDLKILAILSEERIPSLPDVPTAKELGYPIIAESYNGFYVPKDTPDQIVNTLAIGLKKMMNSEKFKEFTKNSKIKIYDIDGEILKNRLQKDFNNFKNNIKK